MAANHAHPYWPEDVHLPGFQPQALRFDVILGVFFSVCGSLLAAGWIASGNRKHLALSERSMVCWFLCCGVIHLVIEGSVVVNPKFYQDTTGNILNEIWKEYSKADSRYATRDDFVISMEAVTAFLEGPGCFLTVWALLQRLPWRYSAILLVSLGQLYGDVLYFMTCFHGGVERHSRPEFMYFWFYFIIVNSVWIVVPLACIYYSVTSINAIVASVERPPRKEAAAAAKAAVLKQQ